jgi:hypothetical protein
VSIKVKDKKNNVVKTIRGKWNDKLLIKDKQTGKVELFFDASTEPRINKNVLPLDKQLDNESRK